MTWIFSECTDPAYHCIRQYSLAALALPAFILALYSSIRTFLLHHRPSFDLLPLTLNCLTAGIVLSMAIADIETEGGTLSLGVIEVYTYFLVGFGFVGNTISRKQEYRKYIKLTKITFIIVTLVSVCSLIILIILSAVDILKCRDSQGIGSSVLLVFLLPIYIITFIFTVKTRRGLLDNLKATKLQSNHNMDSIDTHLLEHEDQYIRIKLMQIRIIVVTFGVSIVIRCTQLGLFYFTDEEIQCFDNKRIIATNGVEFAILCLQNLSELFPHFTIPLIFWYLPSLLNKPAQTLYMEHVPVMQRDVSHLVADVSRERDVRAILNRDPGSPINRSNKLSKEIKDSSQN